MSTDTGRFQYTGRELEAMDFARNYHEWILDEFGPHLRGTVAEVGAGTGSVSEMLLDRGIERLVAIEPSDNLYPLLEEHFRGERRVETHHGYLSEAAPGLAGRPDAFVYVNVLEHVPDDRAELALVYRTLKPGGHVCIFVPALPALYSEFDRMLGHFRRYTKPTLLDLLKGAGFELVSARYFDVAGIIPWYVFFVLMRRRLGASQVTSYDRFVVPIMRRLEALVTPPVGKNLLVVARKP